MPILPLDHPEPFAATLGVMLYPGLDDDSRKRARSFATSFLAEPIRLFTEAGGEISHEHLRRLVIEGGGNLDDIQDRWWDGSTMGELFKAYFALSKTEPSLATWGNATRLVEINAAKHRVSGSRSSLYDIRRRYISVAHLWAAWSIREREFRSDPNVGYEGWHDFHFFLNESEFLRHWGQTWCREGFRPEPPLPPDVWRVPDDWRPPPREPDWPRSGGIPHIVIPPDQMSHLRGPGRQHKRKGQ